MTGPPRIVLSSKPESYSGSRSEAALALHGITYAIVQTCSRLTIPSARRIGPGSEGQVEPKCFIELGTQWAVEGADQRSDALDVDRSNLLGLSFRVAREPG